MNGDAPRETLTGVWDGAYSYPDPYGAMPPTPFTATLFEAGGVLGGTTHEVAEMGSRAGETICATLHGERSGRLVAFTKTYADMEPEAEYEGDVIYTGVLSEDGLEIEGRWSITGVWSGRFLMTRAGRKTVTARKDASAKV